MGQPGETLANFGVNALAEGNRLSQITPEKRRRVFQQNLEAYVNEVVEDKPVSLSYSYWLNRHGDVFTDSSLEPIFDLKRQFDDDERAGLPKTGIYKAINLASQHVNQAVCLYSPAGLVAFDDNPSNRYANIRYSSGQLYVMYFDGKKINNVAIKISHEGEEWVRSLMLKTHEDIENLSTEQEKIAAFVQTPTLFGDVEEFLGNSQFYPEALTIYRHGTKKYSLAEVLGITRDVFLNKRKPAILTYDKTMSALAEYDLTAKTVLNTYLSVIYGYLKETGRQETELSGCSGGKKISSSELEEMLGIRTMALDNPVEKLLSNLSSAYRLLTQNEAKGYSFDHDGTCKECNQQAKLGPCDICEKCDEKMS